MTAGRRQLTPQWCSYHWAPYQPKGAAGAYASMMMFKCLLENARFRQGMASFKHFHPGRSTQEGVQHVLNAMMRTSRKPVCCLLGDEVMANILTGARANDTVKQAAVGASIVTATDITTPEG